MLDTLDDAEFDSEASSTREAERLLDSLRSKGYRVGGAQAVFGVGDSSGRVRYMVNGALLDAEELLALEEGRLKLPDRRPERRSHATEPAP